MKTLFHYFQVTPSNSPSLKTVSDPSVQNEPSSKKRQRVSLIESDSDEDIGSTKKPKLDNSTESPNGSSTDCKSPAIYQQTKSVLSESPSLNGSSADFKSPVVNKRTKSKLNLYSSPSNSRSSDTNSPDYLKHQSLDFLQPGRIRDAKKRLVSDPEYNPKTLFIPEPFLSKTTPAMRQWWQLKGAHFDTVLFFKMGKFYELFHMDAEIGVSELGLVFMRGDYAHCGFPEVAFDRHATILVNNGYKVARVEQMETPDMMNERVKKSGSTEKNSKVVKREICQVAAAGIRMQGIQDREMNDPHSGFLLAFIERPGSDDKTDFGVCFIDAATCTIRIGQFSDDRYLSRFRTMLAHFPPVHILHQRTPQLSPASKQLLDNTFSCKLKESLASGSEFLTASEALQHYRAMDFFNDGSVQFPTLLDQMLDKSDPLLITVLPDFELAISCFGAIVWYLNNCLLGEQILSGATFLEYKPLDGVSNNVHLVLDSVTITNLDVLTNSSLGTGEGSLLQLLDCCNTAFSKRLLKQWLCSPLCNTASINDRLDAVDDLMKIRDVAQQARRLLKQLPDLERNLTRIHAVGISSKNPSHPDNRAVLFEETTYNKRKIQLLLSTLGGFQKSVRIISIFNESELKSSVLKNCVVVSGDCFPDLTEVLQRFDDAFDHQQASATGTILPNTGTNPDYDEAVTDIESIMESLNSYLTEQKKLLHCRDLKYSGTAKNRFQIEVPDAITSRVPRDYELTSQKKGCKRYWTREIKTWLSNLISAEERKDSALRNTTGQVFCSFDKYRDDWSRAVQCLSCLDVLLALAHYSASTDGVSCRPEFVSSDDCFIEMTESRHPCLCTPDFIPNDVSVGTAGNGKVLLVTGPNMGGKSTLMRQVASIVVLAQTGCYVPAATCRLTPVDRIFTRLGASDRIARGESTFFVELSETASIMQHATKHSLVLLDELGRGTSTFDGTAIAGAVLRELSTHHIGCRTLFSTHYHSLVEDFSLDPNVVLAHLSCVVENDTDDPTNETITFLYKLASGACPKSYGFNAARLASLPEEVIKCAREKAYQFERSFVRAQVLTKLQQTDDEIDIEDLVRMQQLLLG